MIYESSIESTDRETTHVKEQQKSFDAFMMSFEEDDERQEVGMLRAKMKTQRVPKFDLHFRKGY